jgi:UDP-N-acetylmuramoyl-tripeptide--D-alanyl-D-alanine ligase
MRAEIINTSAITIINDCYNANPASMKNALDILTDLRSEKKSRAVFICGEMAELGRCSEQMHSQLGRQIAEAKVDMLITVGKQTEIVAQTAKKQADYELSIKCLENTTSPCNNLKEIINPCDIILVKGSRSARLELVVEKLKEFFP